MHCSPYLLGLILHVDHPDGGHGAEYDRFVQTIHRVLQSAEQTANYLSDGISVTYFRDLPLRTYINPLVMLLLV